MKYRTAFAAAASMALALAAAPSPAVAPALLMLGKQMVQQAFTSMLKDSLLSSLRGMGCKGIALSNALVALDNRGGGLAPKLPGAVPGMPAMPGMPGMPGMPAVPGIASVPGMAAMPGIPPEMQAQLGRMMQGAGPMPPGMVLDPDQAAALASIMQARNQPLSPSETLATVNELFELGVMPAPVQAEIVQCMTLLPQTIPAIGSGMGMLRPMIPMLRDARATLHALTPAEQDEMADAMALELRDMPAAERAAFVDNLDAGFFPPALSQGLKARLGVR